MKPENDNQSTDSWVKDLSFITVRVADANGNTVPRADNQITIEKSGPREVVSSDNGDPANFTPFPSHERETFNGLALVVVRSNARDAGKIKITAKSPGVKEGQVIVSSR